MIPATQHHIEYLQKLYDKLFQFTTYQVNLPPSDKPLAIINKDALSAIGGIIRYTINTHSYCKKDIWLLNKLAKIDIALNKWLANDDYDVLAIHEINYICGEYKTYAAAAGAYSYFNPGGFTNLYSTKD